MNKGALFIPIILFLCISMNTQAQDIQFSQFYQAQLYLNPAFAGSAHHPRAMFHQRIQWPGLDAKYITSMMSFDTYLPQYSSGFGAQVFRDWQGRSYITSTEVQLMYSYELNVTKDFSVRAGLQGAVSSRNIDYSKLLFPDQITNNGVNGQTSIDNHGTTNKSYVDVSTGFVGYSDRFWGGFSAHHINMPNQSFLNDVSRLPVKWTFVAGYKILIDGSHSNHSTIKRRYERSITPTAHYKLQGKSDQVDMGLYLTYDQFRAGAWYRGIPWLKRYRRDLQNNESVVLLAGWSYYNFQISYSYDFTVSKLTPASTGGSHELHISYIFNGKNSRKRAKPMKRLPCPTHYVNPY